MAKKKLIGNEDEEIRPAVEPKPRRKSLTYWFNGALLALAIAILGLPELQTWLEGLPGSWGAIAIAIIGFVGAGLRERTTKPLTPFRLRNRGD